MEVGIDQIRTVGLRLAPALVVMSAGSQAVGIDQIRTVGLRLFGFLPPHAPLLFEGASELTR